MITTIRIPAFSPATRPNQKLSPEVQFERIVVFVVIPRISRESACNLQANSWYTNFRRRPVACRCRVSWACREFRFTSDSINTSRHRGQEWRLVLASRERISDIIDGKEATLFEHHWSFGRLVVRETGARRRRWTGWGKWRRLKDIKGRRMWLSKRLLFFHTTFLCLLSMISG